MTFEPDPDYVWEPPHHPGAVTRLLILFSTVIGFASSLVAMALIVIWLTAGPWWTGPLGAFCLVGSITAIILAWVWVEE